MRATYPLGLGLLLGAGLAGLYLVQLLYTPSGGDQRWLETRLEVRVEGQKPLLLAAEMIPRPPPPPAGDEPWISLEGVAGLVQASFPWEPTPFEAVFNLHLRPALFEQGPEGGQLAPGTWSAAYAERRLSRPDGLGLPPIPCAGELAVTAFEAADGDAPRVGLDHIETLELFAELRCVSAGPDLAWGTGDERTWSVEGPLVLRSGRRDQSSPPAAGSPLVGK